MSANFTGDHIKNIPAKERPYEKCKQLGPSSLTDSELLSVLLRTGTKEKSVLGLSRELLSCGTDSFSVKNLYQWTYERLLDIDGVGPVKAVQILCILELSRRLAKASDDPRRITFNNPEVIVDYYIEDFKQYRQEIVMILLLDNRLRLIREKLVTKGTVNGVFITPREIYAEALLGNAVSIIMIHNHPSGDPTPSEDDILFTAKVKVAGEMIEIPLMDHIIIGDGQYYSFREEGCLDG